MSDRSQWKTLHLLNLYGKPALTETQLAQVGITCYNDTFYELLNSNVIVRNGNAFELTPPATFLIQKFVVASPTLSNTDLRVDCPEIFVVMPFSQPWSDNVFRNVIEPAVAAAGLQCVRGDAVVRIGDLTGNVWKAILRAGLIVAEVSAPNPNVFYEIGLAHALGKDVFILKQEDANIPADFRGAHYYPYSLADLPDLRARLHTALAAWATDPRVLSSQVSALDA